MIRAIVFALAIPGSACADGLDSGASLTLTGNSEQPFHSGLAEPALPGIVFVIDDSLTLRGTSEQPLHTDLPPLIVGGRIYVTDHIGQRIRIYDAAGTATGTIGREGTGELEFQMPYGQNEQLIVDEHDAGVQLILEGVAACPGAMRCLLTRYAEDGTWLAAFAPDARTASLSSWTATIDADGHVYIANLLGDTVVVYSRAGDEVRRLGITTPTVRQLSSPRRGSAPDMMSVLERLRTEPYTMIRSITVLDSLLVVSWQRKNWPDHETAFVADVFDLHGRLKHHGTVTPGFLQRTTDGLAFMRHDARGQGSMEIRSARVVRR